MRAALARSEAYISPHFVCRRDGASRFRSAKFLDDALRGIGIGSPNVRQARSAGEGPKYKLTEKFTAGLKIGGVFCLRRRVRNETVRPEAVLRVLHWSIRKQSFGVGSLHGDERVWSWLAHRVRACLVMANATPSLTRQTIAAISAGPCSTLLNPLGFKRRAPNFWRESDGIFQSINFQASQWGSRDEGSFTINICVTSPLLYTAFTGRALPRNPAVLLWPINRRIGSLTLNRCDQWWAVNSQTDAQELYRDVVAHLERYALPFLDALRAPEQLWHAVQSDDSLTGLTDAQLILVRATLAAQRGDKVTARHLLEQAQELYRGEPFESVVRRTVEVLAPELGDA
jgi:hypothetical protein